MCFKFCLEIRVTIWQTIGSVANTSKLVLSLCLYLSEPPPSGLQRGPNYLSIILIPISISSELILFKVFCLSIYLTLYMSVCLYLSIYLCPVLIMLNNCLLFALTRSVSVCLSIYLP